MPDYLRINFFTFRALYAANEDFRGRLNVLSFSWNNKDFNRYVIDKRIEWLYNPALAELVADARKDFFNSLSEAQETKFRQEIKTFLADFALADPWFNTIVSYVLSRCIFPPMTYVGIRRKVSPGALHALEDFERFTRAHYFPTTEESLSNFKKYGAFRDRGPHSYIHIFTNSRKKKPMDRNKRELKSILRGWGEQGRRGLPKSGKVPPLKYALTDEQVVRKLHPLFGGQEKRKELRRMQKLRERLARLPNRLH